MFPKPPRLRPSVRHPWTMRLVVSMLIIATSTACSGSPSGRPASGGAGKQLVWGKPAEADILDPTLIGSGAASELLNLTYERLVDLDGNLKVIPKLAESWQQTSSTTYVFNLRKGVKFSNGREMTVADVVGSLKRVMDPKTSALWSSQLGIRDVVASGREQVKVTLTRPRASFLAALAASQAAVLPMKELDAGTFDPKKELLGTGPFKVTARSQGESWTFVRNPYYWQPGLPRIEKLTIRILPEDAARIAALRDGSIDFTTFENPDSLRLLKGQANVKTVTQTTTDFYRVDVNAKSSIFRDDRLRQALALSIDRDAVRNVALGGIGMPTAAVSPVFQGMCDPAQVPFAKPDTLRARQLVDAAGAAGKTVEILTAAQVPMASQIAQVIQQNLARTGLKVRIVQLDGGALLKRGYTGKTANFDLVVGWLFGYADPSMVVTWWNPGLADFTKAWMKPDAQTNDLIEKSSTAAPGSDRTSLLRDICSRIAQDANMIPLVSKDAIAAFRTDKVSAVIPPVEGYGIPLRQLAEFRAK